MTSETIGNIWTITILCGLKDNESACNAGDLGLSPWVRKISWRRKWMATYANIFAWRISWKEEPGGLQSIGLQRV